MEDEKIYPVGIVSRRTGLTARQLRYYETLGLVAPSRRGNRRLYSEEDIVRLSVIRERHEAGERLEEIGRRMPVGVPLEAFDRRRFGGPATPRAGPRGRPGAAGVVVAAGEESDLQASTLGRRPPPSLYPLRDRREIEARIDRYERDRLHERAPVPEPHRRKERSHDQPGRAGNHHPEADS